MPGQQGGTSQKRPSISTDQAEIEDLRKKVMKLEEENLRLKLFEGQKGDVEKELAETITGH